MSANVSPSLYEELEKLRKDNLLLRAQLQEKSQRINGPPVGSLSSSESGSKTLVVETLRLPRKVPTEHTFVAKSIHDTDDKSSIRSSASTLGSVKASIPRTVSKASTIQRSTSSCGSLLIRVEIGLLGSVAAPMRVSSRRSPCAVFAVIDAITQEVVWRFVKEYEQIRNFHNLIQAILEPLKRRSRVRLTSLPPREWFMSNIPWQVDVRNDMLNAYFKTISWLGGNKYYLKDTSVQNSVERTLSAFWLHDVVDLASVNLSGGPVQDEMWGFLLSRPNERSRTWKSHYYVLNGAYIDILDSAGSKTVLDTVSLRNARLLREIVFFNADDLEDARYVFHIYERKKSQQRVFTLSAESETVRTQWLTKLQKRITLVNSREIKPKTRFYKNEEFPVQYKLRESPHRSPFLPSDGSSTRLTGSNGDFSSTPNVKIPGTPRLNNVAHSKSESTDFLNRYSAYDTLHTTDNQSVSSSNLFDGGDLYMKISKPVATQQGVDAQEFHNETGRGDPSSLSPLSDSLTLATEYTTATKYVSPQEDNEELQIYYDNNDFLDYEFDTSDHPLPEIVQSPSLSRICGKVFGVMPEHCKYLIMLHSGDKVPSVIARCVERLMDPVAITEIGIFRISGTQTLIQELQEEFEKKGDHHITKANVDVHTTADLLKRYLRSLPACLFGEWDEEKSRSILSQPESSQLEVLRIEMGEIEPIHRAVIKLILGLLGKISQEEETNSMGPHNLGVALSPALRLPGPVLSLFIKFESDLN